MVQTSNPGACFFNESSLGLAHISSGGHRNERVVSYSNAHEPLVVHGRGSAVHCPLGRGNNSDTGKQVEADTHQTAAYVLRQRWGYPKDALGVDGSGARPSLEQCVDGAGDR